MGDQEVKEVQKGGFRATTFLYVLTALDNIGFVANMVSFVLYFYTVMCFDLSSSANTLTNFVGSAFLLSLVGGFISDTYLNRLTTCLLFGSLEVLALAVITVQSALDHLHPHACGKSSCVKGGIAVMFYTSLYLLALGIGGVKGSMTALGADQFDAKNPKEAKALGSFFNWLLLSSTTGALIGVTVVVWISTQKAWHWGFMISTIASFIGFLTLALGRPFYRIKTSSEAPLSTIVQVIVMAIKNRKLPLPESHEDLYEVHGGSLEKIAHTNQMRFLDKASILQENNEPQEWKVCTVTKVEEVKILARMLPILASTIIMNTCLAQLQTFSVQQGNVMNLKLGSFTVPSSSIPVIPLIFLSILVPIYEFLFVPFARKITHHPSGITHLQRVGVGLVLSAISMAIAGVIEVKRRNQGRKDPLRPISVFWLAFQYATFGIADMFTLVGLQEFFYREAPESMKSLSTSFSYLSLSLGFFLSTIFVNVVNAVTKRITPSKQGWLHGLDLNQSNLNLFYWFLAILSCLNFFNYVYWASWYQYKAEDSNAKVNLKDGEGNHDEEEKKDMKAKAKESSHTSEANTEGPSSSDETDDGRNSREWKHG
ncbi:hypothetical protein Fmac_024727 [Flemingia macrophylla]|uniref:Nitrate transporter n=1 Tax=Flemingia macrophylla TaxID=520843 RepID=A0ABD1LQ92_9FABA